MVAWHKVQGAGGTGGPEGAWDLSYAYYDDPVGPSLAGAIYNNVSFSVATQDTTPNDLFFKPDGTKMYVLGQAGLDVNEYSLSTPWLTSSASYVQNFSVSAQESLPHGLFFKPDGTKMYITGLSGDDVNEYDLSTAWDISTASYLQNFSVAAQDSGPVSVWFKNDGTAMYILGGAGDDVNQYSLSTAWDISTASYVQNFSVSGQESAPESLVFSRDGKKMYVMGTVGDDVNEYSLSTAWDISTASFVTNVSVATQETTPTGLFLAEQAGYFYVVGHGNDTVYRYRIDVGFDVSAQETTPMGLSFKPDGTKMYIVGQSGDDINEYDLSVAWDTSTASFLQNTSVAVQSGNPSSIVFKGDGTKLYISDTLDDKVYEYSLSTAWDSSSISYVQSLDTRGTVDSIEGLFFKPDGTELYLVSTDSKTVIGVSQYSLSSAWDISTATYTRTFDTSTQDDTPTGVFFKPDGKSMYVVGTDSDNVNEYSLSTAWNISTATYVQNFRPANQLPEDLFFKDDGTQMFVVGSILDTVISYTLGPQE